MGQPGGFVTDTDVLRQYADHLARAADELKPIQGMFAAGGPATLPIDTYETRTGWWQPLSDELLAFKRAYDQAQSGTEYRVRRIRDAVREASRLLADAAADYDRTDADSAARLPRVG